MSAAMNGAQNGARNGAKNIAMRGEPGRGAPVLVRAARPDDRARVQMIASVAMREFGIEADFDELDRELGRFGDVGPGGAAQLVALRDGVVVASLILSRTGPRALKLSAFYVDGAVRGKGIGRILLQEAIAFATRDGCASIYLETWDRMAAAVSLYTSFGWRRGERLPASSGAEWSFVLELGAGGAA
ncbi:MAG TPA: hypothetical protein DCW29_02840 [Janthinobacterium sp.]|nr:hypothetical protein [Janthinobacterium sp.]